LCKSLHIFAVQIFACVVLTNILQHCKCVVLLLITEFNVECFESRISETYFAVAWEMVVQFQLSLFEKNECSTITLFPCLTTWTNIGDGICTTWISLSDGVTEGPANIFCRILPLWSLSSHSWNRSNIIDLFWVWKDWQGREQRLKLQLMQTVKQWHTWLWLWGLWSCWYCWHKQILPNGQKKKHGRLWLSFRRSTDLMMCSP